MNTTDLKEKYGIDFQEKQTQQNIQIEKKIEEQNKNNTVLEINTNFLNRQEPKYENEALRFEKNIALNISSLPIEDQDKYTKRVVKALIVYLSVQTQKDLFGMGTLDPKNFAKVMKLDDKKLNKICEKPAYKAYKNLKRKYETYIENALFILGFRPLVAEFQTTDENNKKTVVKGINILDEITFGEERINIKGKQKKYYLYKMNNFFKKNLSNYYTKLKIDSYINISNINAENFYLYLKNIYTNYIQDPNTKQWFFSIEQLAELLNVAIENLEPKYQRQNINTKLKKIKKQLEDEIKGINFKWVKSSYNPQIKVLEFSWNNIERVEEIRNAEKRKIFNKVLKLELIEKYKKENKEAILNDTALVEWLKIEWLKKEGETYLINTYMKINKQVFLRSQEEEEIMKKIDKTIYARAYYEELFSNPKHNFFDL